MFTGPMAVLTFDNQKVDRVAHGDDYIEVAVGYLLIPQLELSGISG